MDLPKRFITAVQYGGMSLRGVFCRSNLRVAGQGLLRPLRFLAMTHTESIKLNSAAVHQELGPGFEEVIYQRALALEFAASGLDYSREVWLDVHYRGKKVGRKRVDFIVEQVMVEIKAKSASEDVDFVQTLSYLKASGYSIALLLNFGAKQLGIKRFVNERDKNR